MQLPIILQSSLWALRIAGDKAIECTSLRWSRTNDVVYLLMGNSMSSVFGSQVGVLESWPLDQSKLVSHQERITFLRIPLLMEEDLGDRVVCVSLLGYKNSRKSIKQRGRN